eukprot:8316616-Alexandrium_andersonii.AAC.1
MVQNYLKRCPDQRSCWQRGTCARHVITHQTTVHRVLEYAGLSVSANARQDLRVLRAVGVLGLSGAGIRKTCLQ